MKLRTLFAIFAVFSLVFTGMAFADPGNAPGQNKDGPGYYQHSVTGQVKYFDSHPGSPSQWTFIGGQNGNGECPTCFDVVVVGNYYGHAVDSDFSFDVTADWSDFAFAEAVGGPGGQVYTFAADKFYAYEHGWVNAEGDADTYAYAYDGGNWSYSDAGAWLDGDISVGGWAYSPYCDIESVTGYTFFTGSLFQANGASEDRGDSGFIAAENFSSAEFFVQGPSFVGNDYWYYGETYGHRYHDFGNDYWYWGNDAFTHGYSDVFIDNQGSYRSISGYTYTSTNVQMNGPTFGQLAGSGAVSGFISNGFATGGGSTSFNYSGSGTNAYGSGYLGASVEKTYDTTRVNVSGGSSVSIGGGFSGGDMD